jgi:Bacterial extracellular solute-binding protein/Binding-protein-dependent transport system inner membrane component
MPAIRRSGPERTRPRRFLTAGAAGAAGAVATLLLAGCGSATGSGHAGPSGTSVTAWIVTTGPSPANNVINQAVTAFEKSHPGDHITVSYVENQSYKQKIQLAMGAGNPPTIFWTWGGGPLKQYIDAGGSERTVFRRLIWPLARPVLATLSIYDGLNVWNNFILPLVLTQSSNVSVLPLGLTKFEGQYAIIVPAVMAAVLLSVLPLVALFVLMRRQVMRSLGAIVVR